MSMMKLADKQRVILASGSPRRKELLEGLGLTFEIMVTNTDESLVPGESAIHMVQRLALRKAWAIGDKERSAWTIGADTTVVIDGEILGKPETEADAVAMLSKLSGATHEVIGAFCVINPARAVEVCEVHRTKVTMMLLDAKTIQRYVRTGEPMDKAGAYGIQTAPFRPVCGLRGCFASVMGLPLGDLRDLLASFGVMVAPAVPPICRGYGAKECCADG